MSLSVAKYYPAVKAGRVFASNTAAAGVALPIITGTAVTIGVWNKDPAKDAVILQVNAGYTSGTIALGEFGFGVVDVGFQVATGGRVTAATEVAPTNMNVGQGFGSQMSAITSTLTLAASVGAITQWSGYSIESATAGTGIQPMNWNVDGSIIVPPGHLGYIGCSVAQTGIFTCSVVWQEVDH